MSSPGQTRPGIPVAIGRLAAAACVLAVAACAAPEADLARRAPSLLAGMPQSQLYACAGVPLRTHVSGDTEYLTYRRGQTIVTRDVDYEENPWLRMRGIRRFEPEVT
ncbi:MAG TPA: hypothetical protein VK943_05730, partial [Arenibaculum sp.]|nr:hypothetical protein [Arenibaculum sp.]